MKKSEGSSGRRSQGSDQSSQSTRRASRSDATRDPSRLDSESVDDREELEEFVWQELEEFVAGDDSGPSDGTADVSVHLDQERWWALLVQAVGGRDRLPEA